MVFWKAAGCRCCQSFLPASRVASRETERPKLTEGGLDSLRTPRKLEKVGLLQLPCDVLVLSLGLPYTARPNVAE